MKCTNRGCNDPATATVLVGATPMPKCFRHEREYADRYGHQDIAPVGERMSYLPRRGRHSNGADLATYLNAAYDGTAD